jgi:energy-coupling factor transporter ATP-binding protein EcfA2
MLQYTLKRIASEILSVFPAVEFEMVGEVGFLAPIGSLYELMVAGSSHDVALNRGHRGISLALHRRGANAISSFDVPLVTAFQTEYGNWDTNLRQWLVSVRNQIMTETDEVLHACNCHLTSQAHKPQPPSNIPRLISMMDVAQGPLVVVMGKAGSGKSTVLRHLIRDTPDREEVAVWTFEMTQLDMMRRLMDEYPEVAQRPGVVTVMMPPSTVRGNCPSPVGCDECVTNFDGSKCSAQAETIKGIIDRKARKCLTLAYRLYPRKPTAELEDKAVEMMEWEESIIDAKLTENPGPDVTLREEITRWISMHPAVQTLVLMGASVDPGIDWQDLGIITQERRIRIVVELQAHRLATSQDALNFHPEMARVADQVIWVNGVDKPLNVIKHRTEMQGPVWRPVLFKKS